MPRADAPFFLLSAVRPRGRRAVRGSAHMRSRRHSSRFGTDTWEGPHVTETIESSTPSGSASSTESARASESTGKKRGGGLNSMLIADLKSMAGSMGIAGAGSMKKAQLVEAIKAAQTGARSGSQTTKADTPPATTEQKSGDKSGDK